VYKVVRCTCYLLLNPVCKINLSTLILLLPLGPELDRPYNHIFVIFTAITQVHKSTLERIYSYDLLLTKTMLDEGLSNLGDTTNLRRAIHKLVTGLSLPRKAS